MTQDTNIGGASGRFPATHWSAVLATRSSDPEERSRALEAIAAAYWKPIYKYVRVRWSKSSEDAKDLTQDFFAKLLEKEYLEDFDPSKARLRTFLRICADHFVANEAKAARRLKRGGGVAHVALDFDAAENELQRADVHPHLAASPESVDDFLEKEFIRSLFGIAVDKLRSECESRGKQIHFRLFETYDLESDDARASYAELARKFQVAPTDVTNYLAFARREFRRIALDCLREMTASEDEFRREARALLGVVAE
ncbi:MAG TPA: sigma factor [Candidatus Acidoferrales bacterium]|nr:sigma factor [Candidatus Acidoferrales bacterium]